MLEWSQRKRQAHRPYTMDNLTWSFTCSAAVVAAEASSHAGCYYGERSGDLQLCSVLSAELSAAVELHAVQILSYLSATVHVMMSSICCCYLHLIVLEAAPDLWRMGTLRLLSYTVTHPMHWEVSDTDLPSICCRDCPLCWPRSSGVSPESPALGSIFLLLGNIISEIRLETLEVPFISARISSESSEQHICSRW